MLLWRVFRTQWRSVQLPATKEVLCPFFV
jgi:hypothetical protein